MQSKPLSVDAQEKTDEINNLDATDLIGALDNDQIPKTKLKKKSKEKSDKPKKKHGDRTKDTYRNLLLERLL